MLKESNRWSQMFKLDKWQAIEQEILHSLLSTGWFQKQCSYKLTAFYKNEIKV